MVIDPGLADVHPKVRVKKCLSNYLLDQSVNIIIGTGDHHRQATLLTVYLRILNSPSVGEQDFHVISFGAVQYGSTI
jgi:hypothetical protein